MKKAYIILILSIIVLSILLISFYPKNTINVYASTFYPDSYLNEDKMPNGHLVTVTKRILDEMKIPYKIYIIGWEDAKNHAFNDGGILLSPSYTEERDKYLAFTNDQKEWKKGMPYPDTTVGVTDYVFWGLKGKDYNTSLENIRSGELRIGIISDRSILPEILENKIEVFDYPNRKSGIDALHDNEIDLFLEIDIDIGYEMRQYNITDLHIYGTPLREVPYYIEFSKGYENTRDRFYEKLIKMKESGEFYDIYSEQLKILGLEDYKKEF